MSASAPHPSSPVAQPPRLLDQFRAAARAAGQPESWIEPLTRWVLAFIIFHGKRHPRELGAAARDAFLHHVVQTRKDPLSALDAARTALRLLYQDLLQQPIGELPQPRPPLLLDQLRQVLRLGHYAMKTEQNYVQWATRFILFHKKRHPPRHACPGSRAVPDPPGGRWPHRSQLPESGAQRPTVLRRPGAGHGPRSARRRAARRGKRLPIVLTPEEVAVVLKHIGGADRGRG